RRAAGRCRELVGASPPSPFWRGELPVVVALTVLFDLLVLPAFAARQHEVEHQRDDGAQRDTGKTEFAIADHHAADAEYQGHRHDDEVAGFGEVYLMADQRTQADHGDGTVQQSENAAHYRHRDAQQCRAELADEGQDDSEYGRPGHDLRVVVLGQHHRTGYLGIGGVGWAAEQAGRRSGQAIAQ